MAKWESAYGRPRSSLALLPISNYRHYAFPPRGPWKNHGIKPSSGSTTAIIQINFFSSEAVTASDNSGCKDIEYNTERPHSSLGNLTPEEFAEITLAKQEETVSLPAVTP
jgi:hypothetical protein